MTTLRRAVRDRPIVGGIIERVPARPLRRLVRLGLLGAVLLLVTLGTAAAIRLVGSTVGEPAAAGLDAQEEPAATAATPRPWVAPEPVDVVLPDEQAGVLDGDVPFSLTGDLVVVPGSERAPGPGPARTVRVEVEAGLPVDPDRFAQFVMTTLNDPRGWGADGSVSFARTAGDAEIRVVLASPATIDRMCAPLPTNGKWSCGRYGHAALNAERWAVGARAFFAAGGDITQYRQYLVNHEVGHLLGVQHTGCPAAGQVAPIMLQQSLGLDGCLPNGWPHP